MFHLPFFQSKKKVAKQEEKGCRASSGKKKEEK